jgi:hypothetical protein
MSRHVPTWNIQETAEVWLLLQDTIQSEKQE